MTSLRLRATLALALAAFTAACGGGDGGTGPSFADSVSTADAQDMASGAASTATYLADNLNFGEPSIAAAQAMYTRLMARPEVAASQAQMTHLGRFGAAQLDWRTVIRPEGLQASAGDGCTYSSHGLDDFPYGDPIDANGNGIGDDAAIDVVCTATELGAGDTVYSYIQEQHVAIKEISGSLYGMTLRFSILERYQDNHGNFEQQELKQNAVIDLRSGSASTDQSMAIEYSSNDNGDRYDAGYGEEWGAGFDPVGSIIYGDPLPNGELSLHGRSFFYETDGVNVSFTISTPTVLAYSAACAAVPTNPPFTGGVLLGKLNNNSSQASFEVTFTSCGNYTVDVNGAYDEIVVSAQP